MGLAYALGETVDEDRRDLGPKRTVAQAALIRGFPADCEFQGRKTAAYRQVGNAFPLPVVRAVGEATISALRAADAGQEPPGTLPGGLLVEVGPRQLSLTG